MLYGGITAAGKNPRKTFSHAVLASQASAGFTGSQAGVGRQRNCRLPAKLAQCLVQRTACNAEGNLLVCRLRVSTLNEQAFAEHQSTKQDQAES